MYGEKSLAPITRECWTSPGDSTPQNSSYMKTIQIRRIRPVEDCWRSKDDQIASSNFSYDITFSFDEYLSEKYELSYLFKFRLDSTTTVYL